MQGLQKYPCKLIFDFFSFRNIALFTSCIKTNQRFIILRTGSFKSTSTVRVFLSSFFHWQTDWKIENWNIKFNFIKFYKFFWIWSQYFKQKHVIYNPLACIIEFPDLNQLISIITDKYGFPWLWSVICPQSPDLSKSFKKPLHWSVNLDVCLLLSSSFTSTTELSTKV